jgi:hypothetical protein
MNGAEQNPAERKYCHPLKPQTGRCPIRDSSNRMQFAGSQVMCFQYLMNAKSNHFLV